MVDDKIVDAMAGIRAQLEILADEIRRLWTVEQAQAAEIRGLRGTGRNVLNAWRSGDKIDDYKGLVDNAFAVFRCEE